MRANRDHWNFIKTARGLCIAAGDSPVWELPEPPLAALVTTMATRQNNGSVLLRRRLRRRIPCRPDWVLEQTSDGALLRGRLADAAGTPCTMEFSVCGEDLAFAAEVGCGSEIELSLCAGEDENIYGFGEQFTHLEMSGRAFTLCVSEQGIGRGAQPISALVSLASPGSAGDDFTTYAPLPLFVTSRSRAMLCEENTIYRFDVKKHRRDRITFSACGQVLHGRLFCASSPLAAIEKHTACSGRLRPLPDWAYGAVLGIRGGRETAMRVLEQCLAHGAPVSALWIEDWEGRRGKNGGPPLWWRWYPDETIYPDFRRWAASLAARGIALLGYANPFLSVCEDSALYTEGRAARYFVQNPDGSDWESHFFSGKEYRFVCVDLTNPAAYDWLKEKMRVGMLENGLAGWMADYGEYTPLDGKTADPDILRAHCELPLLWAKLNSELIDETGSRGRVLTFHRSAAMGSSRYATAYWAGDQNPTFDRHDGMLSGLTALLTSGISGMSINHTDIGGFTTLITPIYRLTRKKEVMLRWLEFAAFTPVFRTHDGNYANPQNYQFYYDEDGFRQYARMARLHAALGFYWQQLQQQAAERGWPMVRALWLHYPEDPACRALSREYLLGEDLLVAPVADFGADQVLAYLPAGKWRLPWDGACFEGGGWRKLPAPLGRPAVLVRAASPQAQRLQDTLRAALGED